MNIIRIKTIEEYLSGRIFLKLKILSFKLTLLSAILTIMLSSCYNSPMDVDTPRKKTGTSSADLRIKPRMSEMSIIVNEKEWIYNIKIGSTEIDTTYNPAIIWMYLSLESNEIYNYGNNKICISGININIDSLPINFGQLMICGQPCGGSYTDYSLIQVNNSSIDTFDLQNQKKNFSVISFEMNMESKEVEAILLSKIYDYRLIDNVRQVDSATISAVIKFIY